MGALPVPHAGANIGATATNTQGLTNAFATVANLANLTTGTSPGAAFPQTGASPAAKLNTLANLLNTCTAAPPPLHQPFPPRLPRRLRPCQHLRRRVESRPQSRHKCRHPLHTIHCQHRLHPRTHHRPRRLDALHHLHRRRPRAPPASVSTPPATSGSPTTRQRRIQVLSHRQSHLPYRHQPTGSLRLLRPGHRCQRNVWIPYEESPGSVNHGVGAVSVLNSSGQSISGPPGTSLEASTTPCGRHRPQRHGLGRQLRQRHLTLLPAPVSPLRRNRLFAPSFAFPAAIAIDANHNAWLATRTTASSPASLRRHPETSPSPAATVPTASPSISAAMYGQPTHGDSVSQLPAPARSSPTVTPAEAGSHPQGIAIDGAGTSGSPTTGSALTQLAGSSSSPPGHSLPHGGPAPDPDLLEPFAIAIDASGNLWVTNFGSNTLTEFVGLATCQDSPDRPTPDP